jgi:NADPH:quinone reductase-like Zn-dependent oxidoreductase
MATQTALWLPKIGAEFTLGKNEIPEPGPGEVLVKLAASALNPLDVVIPKSGFFEITKYPAILGEEGAGIVQKVGDGVTNLVRGDKVLFQTTLKNKYASFQEYCLVIAELAAKVGACPLPQPLRCLV